MRSKSILCVSLAFAIFLTGCASSNTAFDLLHEKNYFVYGRVLNTFQNPVEDCRIILIKRRMFLTENQNPEVRFIKAVPVAISSGAGDYSFAFEPSGSNDMWLCFDGRKHGYDIKFVGLNKVMGDSIFQYPGNNPVNISVVMTKMPERETLKKRENL